MALRVASAADHVEGEVGVAVELGERVLFVRLGRVAAPLVLLRDVRPGDEGVVLAVAEPAGGYRGHWKELEARDFSGDHLLGNSEADWICAEKERRSCCGRTSAAAATRPKRRRRRRS